jgi:hypothetical protein
MADRFPLQPEFLTDVGILLGIERPSVLGDLGAKARASSTTPVRHDGHFQNLWKFVTGKTCYEVARGMPASLMPHHL